MGLEKVIEEIGLSAKKAEQGALDEANKEAEAILSNAKKEAKSILNQASKKADAEVSAMKQRELSSLKLTLRRQLLNSRKQLIEEIRTEASQKIAELPNKEEVLSKLLKKAISELPEAKVVLVNSSDKALMKKLAPTLEVKELPSNHQGLIVEDAQGEVRVNYTFAPIMDRIFEEKLSETYNEVFGSA